MFTFAKSPLKQVSHSVKKNRSADVWQPIPGFTQPLQKLVAKGTEGGQKSRLKSAQQQKTAVKGTPGASQTVSSPVQMRQARLPLRRTIEQPAVMQLLTQEQKQSDAGQSASIHAVASAGVQGSGGKLPYYNKIQASFGRHSISRAQAYTGRQAASACHAIGAKAYATGSKVAFAENSPSLHTAAHEATHIVQQRAGVNLKAGVGKQGDQYECHADTVADLVVRGKSAQSALDSMAGKQSQAATSQSNVQAMYKVKVGGEGKEGSNEEDKGSKSTELTADKSDSIIDQMSSLLDSGPIFIGESHNKTRASDAIIELINLGKVKKLFLEMPEMNSEKTKQIINPITTEDELLDVRSNFFRYIGFFPSGPRYYALAEQAIKRGAKVYSADGQETRTIQAFSEQMVARNEYTSNLIKSQTDETGAYTVVLGGMQHYTSKEYNPIHEQSGKGSNRVFDLS